MPHAANVIERPQLVRRPLFVLLAEDELDRLGQPARRFGAPHFAVAAGADVLDQPVARQRLDVDVDVVASRLRVLSCLQSVRRLARVAIGFTVAQLAGTWPQSAIGRGRSTAVK